MKKKYVWAAVESKVKENLESDCKKRYPGHIILKRSVVKVDYTKDKPYKQIFILFKMKG